MLTTAQLVARATAEMRAASTDIRTMDDYGTDAAFASARDHLSRVQGLLAMALLTLAPKGGDNGHA